MVLKSDGNGKWKPAWVGIIITLIAMLVSYAFGRGVTEQRVFNLETRVVENEKKITVLIDKISDINSNVREVQTDTRWIREKLSSK